MKVYTRTGDKGTSSLYDGTRESKTHAVFAALGDCDELNAHLGVALEQLKLTLEPPLKPLIEQLETLQSRLLDVGSRLATPLSTQSSRKLQHTQFAQSHVDLLETWIDTVC
jgi:cob(I)alamin adenosyltransferase